MKLIKQSTTAHVFNRSKQLTLTQNTIVNVWTMLPPECRIPA